MLSLSLYLSASQANPPLVAAVAALGLALLLLAVLIEVVRRRRAREQRQRLKRGRVQALAREKGLAQDELAYLLDFLERRDPEEPYEAVTMRPLFEACVAEEMAELERAGNTEQMLRAGALLRTIRNRLGLEPLPYGQPIETTRDLTPGQTVYVTLARGDSGNWTRMRVTGLDEACFCLAPRGAGGAAFAQLHRGSRMGCRMCREDDARYEFDAEVLEVLPEEGPAVVLRHTSVLERLQAREFYRVHVELAASVEVLPEWRPDDVDPGLARATARCDGAVTSLSAGGLAVTLPEAVTPGHLLRVGMKLPGEPPFKLYVEVVDCVPAGVRRYLARGPFFEMAPETSERIAACVAERQKMLLAAEGEEGLEPPGGTP